MRSSWASPSCKLLGYRIMSIFPLNFKQSALHQFGVHKHCVCISLTSYLRLSPKVPISSTAWTGMLPCSLKFIEGSGFLSSSWSPWEMKWSTSWGRNVSGALLQRMRWPGDCPLAAPLVSWPESGDMFFCLTYLMRSSIPTLSHNRFYTFSVIGHKATLSLLVTHPPKHTHTIVLRKKSIWWPLYPGKKAIREEIIQ